MDSDDEEEDGFRGNDDNPDDLWNLGTN